MGTTVTLWEEASVKAAESGMRVLHVVAVAPAMLINVVELGMCMNVEQKGEAGARFALRARRGWR